MIYFPTDNPAKLVALATYGPDPCAGIIASRDQRRTVLPSPADPWAETDAEPKCQDCRHRRGSHTAEGTCRLYGCPCEGWMA